MIPEPIRGKFVVHVRVAYTGDAAEGERLVAPMRSAGPLLVDAVREMPYTEVGTIHNDPTTPAPFVERSGLLRSLEPETVATLVAHALPPIAVVELRQLGGALSRTPDRESAVGFRAAAYSLFVGGMAMVEALAPWLTSHDTSPEAMASVYEEADYARLRAMKKRHDPTNMFRINHNVPPEE